MQGSMAEREGLFTGEGVAVTFEGPHAQRQESAMRAIWNDVVLAESDDTVVVEGNHYFPAESLRREHFTPSSRQSVCPWKGTANYYDVTVGNTVNPGAAWYYPTPKRAAEQIRDRVAFWMGVEVVESGST